MPIYFAWFTTALLSVGGDANDQNLPQSGRLLYCVGRGFIDTYPAQAPFPCGSSSDMAVRRVCVSLIADATSPGDRDCSYAPCEPLVASRSRILRHGQR